MFAVVPLRDAEPAEKARRIDIRPRHTRRHTSDQREHAEQSASTKYSMRRCVAAAAARSGMSGGCGGPRQKPPPVPTSAITTISATEYSSVNANETLVK